MGPRHFQNHFLHTLSLLIRSSTRWETLENIQYIWPTPLSILPLVTTTGMSQYEAFRSTVKYFFFSCSLLGDKPPTVQTSTKKKRREVSIQHLAAFFFPEHQCKRRFKSTSLINNSMTVQTHVTRFNDPTTVHTYTIVTQEQVNSLLQ